MADVLASLGIISVAVGFAFKDVLENLLAGVLLLVRDPFKSGDEITVAGFEGTVEGVTVRETLLRTFDGRRVLIPNSTVYINPLRVDTHFPLVRTSFTVVLDPAADLAAARDAVTAALGRVDGVDGTTRPQAVVTDLTQDGLLVECRFWSAADRRTRTAVLDAAVQAVRDALEVAGVAAPVEHVVVDLRGQPAQESPSATSDPA